jgi:CRISPR/Cas system type I-B associated protein Csh2 (Cas7 group RAMP superfamily)
MDASDVFTLRSVLVAYANGKWPGASNLNSAYRILRNLDASAVGCRLFSLWDEMSFQNSSRPDASTRIKLVYFVRHTGDAKRADQLTAFIEDGSDLGAIETEQHAILATMRAAILMDLYEAHPDPLLLRRARKLADRAWALSPSGETSRVYDRLRRLENHR